MGTESTGATDPIPGPPTQIFEVPSSYQGAALNARYVAAGVSIMAIGSLSYLGMTQLLDISQQIAQWVGPGSGVAVGTLAGIRIHTISKGWRRGYHLPFRFLPLWRERHRKSLPQFAYLERYMTPPERKVRLRRRHDKRDEKGRYTA